MMVVRSVASVSLAMLCACGQATSSTAGPAPAGVSSNEFVASADGAPAALPAAPGSTENATAAEGRLSDAAINTNVNASLKDELVGVGKVDGQPITDVQAHGKCETVFVTSRGSVVVHWSKVGNFAGRVDRGTTTIPIDDGTGVHAFTMPEEPTFARVDGSFGLLADNCQK